MKKYIELMKLQMKEVEDRWPGHLFIKACKLFGVLVMSAIYHQRFLLCRKCHHCSGFIDILQQVLLPPDGWILFDFDVDFIDFKLYTGLLNRFCVEHDSILVRKLQWNKKHLFFDHDFFVRSDCAIKCFA
ncbi:hypothetical protein SAMN02746089_00598 [Caldanaerobius fijiensis DSM 17918]|uniref:Uncharacterized protein n=1 Tax=Caldanaerobius fijiensis DSM 17918 TaxID=1121256 RepID=A0A1M4VDL4_9THEO|nr:hypothetical protein SAMN02746089_00598 [Caldanaerobius fijiensis DSM 17918]